MTDLSAFGGGIDQPADQDETGADHDRDRDQDDSGPAYPNGRCPAITSDLRRCRAPVSRMKASDGLCGVHGQQFEPLTIDAGAEQLIRLTGARAARCRAVQHNGERCTNSCGPLEHYCGMHQDWDHETVDGDELEDGELDVDLIVDALEAVQEVPA